MSCILPARAVILVALGTLLCTASPASCGGGPALQIQLTIDPCAEVDPLEVRRFLRIELDARILQSGDLVPPDAARAAVSCEEDRIRLDIDDPITGKALVRKLAQSSTATATRARLLALALAELLLASWAELSLDSPVAPLPAAAAPPPRVDRAAEVLPVQARLAASEQVRRHTQSAPTSRIALGLHGVLLSFPAEGIAVLLGGALRLAGDLRPRLHWQIDLGGSYGTSRAEAGVLSAAFFGAAAALHYQHLLGSFRLRAGGGGRLGAAWLRGHPDPSRQVLGMELWGPVAGPLLRLGAARDLPKRLAAALEIEVGYMPIAVRGTIDGGRALGVEGVWVGVSLGVSRAL